MTISIVFVHYSTDDIRSYSARECLKRFWSLAGRDPEVQIICVNNSSRDEDFKKWCHLYYKNPENNFAKARNWGAANSTGEYLCFVDNDIYPDTFFWKECVALLEKFPERKLLATPIYCTSHVLSRRCKRPPLDGHAVNSRAGSNCLFMKRESFLEIGEFSDLWVHRVGVEYTNRFGKMGYQVILTQPGLARDLGIRNYPYAKYDNPHI